MESTVNMFELRDWLNALTDLHLLRKLMDFGILPKEKEYLCKRCKLPLTLHVDNWRIDKYKWFCDNYISIRKQKRVRCGSANWNILCKE